MDPLAVANTSVDPGRGPSSEVIMSIPPARLLAPPKALI